MKPTNASAAGPIDRARQAAGETVKWMLDHSLDLAIASVAAVAVALALLALRRFGHRLVRTGDDATDWRTIFGRVLAQTKMFFIVIVALRLVLGHTAAPPFLQRLIAVLFIVAVALQAAIWARELVIGYIEHRIGGRDVDHGRLGSAIGIIRLLVTVALFAIALVVILDNLGVNVTGLVAGLGIGGIAIGLAAQDIFADLFAALSIIFDRPFKRGDQITFGTTTGTVEQIGLKTTRVRALSGEEVVISNKKLLDQNIQNWALLERRRALMQIGVTYETPPEMLERLPAEIRKLVEAQATADFDRAHVFRFGASSIDLEIVFHVNTHDYADFMDVQQKVMLAMIRRFAELKVAFAYPTQVTYTAAPDGTLVMPYPDHGAPHHAPPTHPSENGPL